MTASDEAANQKLGEQAGLSFHVAGLARQRGDLRRIYRTRDDDIS